MKHIDKKVVKFYIKSKIFNKRKENEKANNKEKHETSFFIKNPLKSQQKPKAFANYNTKYIKNP